MINNQQMRTLIVRPALKETNLYLEDAEELLIGAFAHESKGGTYLAQLSGGPALGFFGMETATYLDLWNNFLVTQRPALQKMIMNACNFLVAPQPKELVNNIKFATIMARVKFLTIAEPLPPRTDIHAIAAYWKKYYNTELGAGKVEDFIANYHAYCEQPHHHEI